MELIFQTKHYKTRVSKYATIYSNDPAEPTTKIHLTATIDPQPDTTLPFSLAPDSVSLSQDNKKAEIELTNTGQSKLLIQHVGGAIEGLSVDIKNEDPKPGQETKLRFKWDTDFQKENLQRSVSFAVTGDGGEMARFSVPIMVQGTNPTPPKVATKRPARPRGKTTNTSNMRTPARHSTAVQKPSAVKPAGKTQGESSSKLTPQQQLENKKAASTEEKKTTEPQEKKTPESEENQ